MVDLDKAGTRLEAAMGRVSQVHWGSAAVHQVQSFLEGKREKGDDTVDVRFDHSWTREGIGPGLGWYWIPRGGLNIDTYYPARLLEIKRSRHLARRIRRLSPPVPLLHSFACVTEKGMADRGPNRPLKRRKEGWQEDWMEEDDLLGEDQDPRRQL